MNDTGFNHGGALAWVRSINSAVWVTNPSGDICYVNEKAEALLERTAEECIGRPCNRVICGVETSGDAYCAQSCVASAFTQGSKTIDSVQMHIAGACGTNRWVRVLIIAIDDPDRPIPWLVHCALDDNRAHRFEDYLDKVCSRTPRQRAIQPEPVRIALTKREEEILKLLSNDETLHGIANSLHLSYATVRNHVHHILNKLGVHSIMEAIASYLLIKEE